MGFFDAVCRVDLQEVDNAIQQTLREVGQRFDFRNTPTEVRREDHTLHLRSADEFKLRALNEVLQEKLARRQVPLRALQAGPIEPGNFWRAPEAPVRMPRPRNPRRSRLVAD